MTAGAVLDHARSQLGTVEARDGSNPYGRAYGMDRVAWCNQFTWWCFVQAGLAHLTPKSAYTPTTYQWYRQQGRADTTPRVGSLVFFDWPDSINRIQHIGLVEAVNGDGTVTTIEGNTSSGAAGSQHDGGGVWRRKRRAGIVGYGHPAYDGAAPQQATQPGSDGSHLPPLTYGMRGNPAVARWQQWSNDHPWAPPLPLLPVTGNYLGQTQHVVRLAQQQLGITGPDADGSVIGPRTNRAMWARGWRG